jgi:ankyrin repeat protein
MTPIHYAASCGVDRYRRRASSEQVDWLAIVQLLIECGARVDAVNSRGTTPLIVAACKGQEDIVRALIDAGAQCGHADARGDTALHFAATRGFVRVVDELLAARGCDVNATSKLRHTRSIGPRCDVTRTLSACWRRALTPCERIGSATSAQTATHASSATSTAANSKCSSASQAHIVNARLCSCYAMINARRCRRCRLSPM